MATNRQPSAPWRVEFNECGWSSRFWVVRGWRECGPVDVFDDFANADDTYPAAAPLNA